MRSIEHGSGHQEQLAFSGSAALLLPTGHPSRERAGALARAEGVEQVCREELLCREGTVPGLPPYIRYRTS